MKLQEKNFVKASIRFYIFARDSNKFQELLEKRESESVAVESCGCGECVAVGYHMDEIFALAEKLYGNNLIIAMSGPSTMDEMRAATIENGSPFEFETALYGDIGIVVLTKDRTPFGESIDEVIKMVRAMLIDIADDVGAVFGELSIGGEVEEIELSGDCLTKCEETPDERKTRHDERQRRMAHEASDSFAELLLELFSHG